MEKKRINGVWLTEEEALEANMPLVHKICNGYRVNGYTPGVTRDDLFSVGCIGLLLAYREFDESRGFQFSTFAHSKISNEILNAIYSSGAKGFTLPKNFLILVTQLKRDDEEEGEPKKLAARYGVTVQYVRRAQAFLAGSTHSFDAPLEETGTEPHTLIGGLPDDLSALEADEFLDILPERHRELLEYRIKELSQTAIAERTGLSQVHVSRLLKQAMQWAQLYIEDPTEGIRAIRTYKRKRGKAI